MCAALLGWPQATFASGVDVEDGHLKVTREVDEGQQQIAVRLPAVVTTDLRLNTPRRASQTLQLYIRDPCATPAHAQISGHMQVCILQGSDCCEEEAHQVGCT